MIYICKDRYKAAASSPPLSPPAPRESEAATLRLCGFLVILGIISKYLQIKKEALP